MCKWSGVNGASESGNKITQESSWCGQRNSSRNQNWIRQRDRGGEGAWECMCMSLISHEIVQSITHCELSLLEISPSLATFVGLSNFRIERECFVLCEKRIQNEMTQSSNREQNPRVTSHTFGAQFSDSRVTAKKQVKSSARNQFQSIQTCKNPTFATKYPWCRCRTCADSARVFGRILGWTESTWPDLWLNFWKDHLRQNQQILSWFQLLAYSRFLILHK